MITLIEINIKKALAKTLGKANVRIYPDCFLNACQSQLKPPSKIKVGRKIINRPFGSISFI